MYEWKVDVDLLVWGLMLFSVLHLQVSDVWMEGGCGFAGQAARAFFCSTLTGDGRVNGRWMWIFWSGGSCFFLFYTYRCQTYEWKVDVDLLVWRLMLCSVLHLQETDIWMEGGCGFASLEAHAFFCTTLTGDGCMNGRWMWICWSGGSCFFLFYTDRCQTYEGGFAGFPGQEAHGGYSFCGLATLVILNKPELCDLPRLLVSVI